ncbi:MAG TPA: hypothetical protein VJM50_14800 [Pyrinomonadaceae bacterium]|nr:hypothetical protein [Pyrinomonadaceae bacterium]
MTNSQIRIRNIELPRHASIGLRLLSALLFSLAFAATAFAQNAETRITTLLPTLTECKSQVDSTNWQTVADKSTVAVFDKFGGHHKSACYLEFSIASIPADAKISEAVLRVVQAPKQPNTLNHVINVASIPKGDWTKHLADYEDERKEYRLGIIRSGKPVSNASDTMTQISGTLLRPEANKQYIGLLLSPRPSGSGRKYFPFTGDTTNTAGNQPRLIIKYTVSRTAPRRSPDSQSDGWAAMRSPLPFMPQPNTPPQDNYRTMQVFDGTKISSYKAATYDGLNYVVRTYANRQTNTTDWHLDAQDPFGNVVWSKLLPSALSEKARVVVNDAGRLTIVSQNRFIIYQLNAANRREPPSAHVMDKTLSGVKGPAALLPGADGGVYVIDDTDLYALNPDLQMLWRMGVGTSASARMTLGPDGQYLYATVFLPDGQSKKPGLLAINAQNGKAPSLGSFPPETKTFHNPVVIKSGNAEYIYLAANSQNSGVLRTLRNQPATTGDRIASISRVKDELGLFSQPAADAGSNFLSKELYVVWKENQSSPARLVSIKAITGTIEDRETAPQITVAETSDLWSGGNLVMDTKGNIFFWENGIFYGYGGAKQLFARNLAGLPSGVELLFGSDGTLYLQDSKIGSLTALIPSYQLPNAQSGNISSPTHLSIEGTVDKDTRLSAGGNVTVGSEFKVKQGSTLTVKTNVPQ